MRIDRHVSAALIIAACAGGAYAQQYKYSETNTTFQMIISTQYGCDMQAAQGLPSANAIASVYGDSCGYPNPVTFDVDPDMPGEVTSSADAYSELLVCPVTQPPGDECRIAKAHYQASAGYSDVTHHSTFMMGFARRESREHGDCDGCKPWGAASGGCSIVAAWEPVSQCTPLIESIEVTFLGDTLDEFASGPCLATPVSGGSGVGDPVVFSDGEAPLNEATFAGFRIDFFDAAGAPLGSVIEQSALFVSESSAGDGQFSVSVYGDLLDGLVPGAGDHTPIQVAIPAGAASAQYSGELYTINRLLRYDVNVDGAVDYDDRLELASMFGSALGDASYSLRADLDRDLDVDADDADILEALPCMADLDHDGAHTYFDVNTFLAWYGASDARADLTGDGLINFFDLSVFLILHGQACP